VPDLLCSHVERIRPDVVNLHWIGRGFVRPETLAKIERPLVWTLHDSWAFTGGCHLPGPCRRYLENCGKCPALGSKRRDLSSWVLGRKLKSWRSADMTLVAPSRWLAQRASQSALLSGRRVEVIPNGIDLSVYRPREREAARSALGFDRDALIVLFSAMWATQDPNKGLVHLLNALRWMSQERRVPGVVLAVVGSTDVPATDCGIPVRSLGVVGDETKMATIYAAADVLVVPSREENLPNVVMEALACGTPAVAFNVGGNPELIEDGITGALVPPYDERAFGQAVLWTLGWDTQTRRTRARSAAERRFAVSLQADRYARLYASLCERVTV
jgi:glycosyltransferase involved in cell wall biosynthesis